MTELAHRKSSNNALLADFANLSHDAVGNRLSLSASLPLSPTSYSGSTSYTYDNKEQLTQESSTRAGGYSNGYGYDLVGNPTTWKGTAQTFNSVNQNTFGGTVAFDSNGNPQSWNGAALAYNANDKLVSIGSVLSAGYGSDGLRAWKQSSAGRTYFLYDGLVPVCEVDGGGNVTAVNTVGATGVLARHVNGTGGGSVFYAFDPQGSVAVRLDTSGNILSSHVNEAWGTQVSSGTGYGSDPYAGYGGQWGYYRDVETGLHLLGHRYYDASRGRFINRDPIGYEGGINLYAYCGNNPIRRTDASGFIYPKQDPYGIGAETCPGNGGCVGTAGQMAYACHSAVSMGSGNWSASGWMGGGYHEVEPGFFIPGPGEGISEPADPVYMYHYSPIDDLHLIGMEPPIHMTDTPIHLYPDPWPYLESIGIGNKLPTTGYEVDCTGLKLNELGTSSLGIGDYRYDKPIPIERIGLPIPLPPKPQ